MNACIQQSPTSRKEKQDIFKILAFWFRLFSRHDQLSLSNHKSQEDLKELNRLRDGKHYFLVGFFCKTCVALGPSSLPLPSNLLNAVGRPSSLAPLENRCFLYGLYLLQRLQVFIITLLKLAASRFI